MADQQIDELSLKIEVKQNNVAKDIDKISAAIDKLTASLKGMKELSGVLDKLAKVKIPSSITKATNNVAASAPPLKMEEIDTSSMTKVSETQKVLKDGTVQLTQKYQELNGEMMKTYTLTNGIVTQMSERAATEKEQATNIEKTTEELEEQNSQLDENEKKTKKNASAFSKLTKSIGRIAFYRAIRTALKEITQAAKEGLGNLRTIDKDLDTSMKKISLSGITIKNSFAAMLSPIIKSIQPLITRLADGIARIVNRITEARAALAGQSKYTKIVTSDMTEYQEQLDKTQDSLGSLLEFDTFTLQQRGQEQEQYLGTVISPVEMTVDEAGDVLEKFEAIKNTLIAIAATIAGMVVLSKISSIINGLGGMKTALSGVGDVLKKSLSSGIGFVFAGVLELIIGIKDMIKVFREGGTAAEKARAILITLAGALTLVTGLMIFFKASQMAKTIVGLIATVATAGALVASIVASTKSASKDIQSFETGGSFKTADMFYANEDGNTELIASTNNGGAVMNMQQLQSAIYNGMRMAMADGGDKELVLRVDSTTLGKVVANSAGFVSEVNRRNSSLKLR